MKWLILLLVSSDWCEKLLSPLISNWPLILVAIVGIWVAVRALKPAEIAAQSAQKSADALINSERAWIMADIAWAADVPHAPKPTTLRVCSSSGTEGKKFSIFVCLVCKNDGKTPAWITERSAWLGLFYNLPTTPDTKQPIAFTYSDLQPLSVGQSSTVQNEPTCKGDYPEVGGPALVIYGVVKYRDAFGSHETWYGYAIHGDPGARPRLERLAGYPEYNKNT